MLDRYISYLSLGSVCLPCQVLHHHYRSLGGWTFAFSDYITLNITADLDDPALDQLNAIVNPYGGCAVHRNVMCYAR